MGDFRYNIYYIVLYKLLTLRRRKTFGSGVGVIRPFKQQQMFLRRYFYEKWMTSSTMKLQMKVSRQHMLIYVTHCSNKAVLRCYRNLRFTVFTFRVYIPCFLVDCGTTSLKVRIIKRSFSVLIQYISSLIKQT